MKIVISIALIVCGGLYYQHYQTEQVKNAEFGRYWKEVANPTKDALMAKCPKEGSAKTWCEAEAWQVWGEMLRKKKKEIWPNG